MCMRSFNTGGSDARGMKHFAYNCVAILVEFMVRNDFEKVFSSRMLSHGRARYFTNH